MPDVYGGDGGTVRIMADVQNPNNESKIYNAEIHAGNGGDAIGQAGLISAGLGGNLTCLGTLYRAGSRVRKWRLQIDPINLKFGSNSRIEGSNSVKIYTDEGGTIDMTQLKEGAISAKVITILTKARNNEGGMLNLTGVSGKIFKASEKVEIFADKIITDPGVTVQNLCDAPSVGDFSVKILYRASLSAEKYIVGKPGEKVSVPVKLINAGPKIDEYKFFKESLLPLWSVGNLPLNTTIVGGLRYTKFNLSITFPTGATPGTRNKITIKAVSQTDSSVIAKAEIIAVVIGTDSDGDGVPDNKDAFPSDPTEWTDTDKDGIGDVADTDDDNDGMPDTWENQYDTKLSGIVNDASQDADNDGGLTLKNIPRELIQLLKVVIHLLMTASPSPAAADTKQLLHRFQTAFRVKCRLNRSQTAVTEEAMEHLQLL